MNIKRNLSLLVCFILVLALSACKGPENQDNSAVQSGFESSMNSESFVSSSVSDVSGENGQTDSSDNASSSAETTASDGEAVTDNKENSTSNKETPKTENVGSNTAPHNHNYVLKKTNAATCTVNGYNLYSCECGNEKKETINKTGHKWGNWVTVTAPTTTAEGKQTRTCTVCKATESKAIAKLTTSTSISIQDMKNEVFRLVNEERAKNGLSPLTYRSDAQKSADIRAKEIATPKNFSHTRPDGSDCFTALADAGVNYMTAGENIAYGQRTPEEVMTSWLNSPGHRANILNKKFTGIAVGVEMVNGVYYWVQLFVG